MASFFSGTDNEELSENATNYAYYVSLIVNNAGQYVARVAFPGKLQGRKISYSTKDGKYKEFSVGEEKNVSFYYDLEIVIQELSYQDKIIGRFKKKFGRDYGSSLVDCFDVFSVMNESSSLVSPSFIAQYDRVIASKPSFQTAYGYNNSNNQKNARQSTGYQRQLVFPEYEEKTLPSDVEQRAIAVRFIKFILASSMPHTSMRQVTVIPTLPLKTLGEKLVSEYENYGRKKDGWKDSLKIANSDIENTILEFSITDTYVSDDELDAESLVKCAIGICEEYKDAKALHYLGKLLNEWTWEPA